MNQEQINSFLLTEEDDILARIEDISADCTRKKLFGAVKERLAAMTGLKILSEFTDDHCPCFDVRIKSQKGDFNWSLHYASREGAKAVYLAEEGVEKGIESVKEWILTDHIGEAA